MHFNFACQHYSVSSPSDQISFVSVPSVLVARERLSPVPRLYHVLINCDRIVRQKLSPTTSSPHDQNPFWSAFPCCALLHSTVPHQSPATEWLAKLPMSPMSPSLLFSSPTLTTGLLLLLVSCLLSAHFAAAENVLLPKRLVAQIGSKVNLQFSDNEIENAFLLGKDMVTRNTRHENDLVRDGTSNWCSCS